MPWRQGLLGLLLLAGGLTGCIDNYLVPDAALDRLSRFSDGARAGIALPAVRERDGQRVWVRADLVAVDAAGAAGVSGHRVVPEANSKRRVSPVGVAMLVAGVVALSLGMVFIGTSNACSSRGALPCLSGSGDLALPLTLGGAALLFTGTGVTASRAVDSHPAEISGADGQLLYLAVPADASQSAKTPLE